MFIIKNNFFTEIMLKNYKKHYYYLNEPGETIVVLYIFNHKINKSKYSIMSYYIYSSRFVTNKVYKDMEFLFYYSQKTYWALQKYATIWKKTHEKTSISSDLMLTPLKTYKSDTLITLYEAGKPYPFYLPDLYNIIEEALTHCSHDYFLEIKKIKNPYTNLPFHITNIYKIFLAFENSTYIISILFKGFIQCNCNENKFLQIYEPIIREYCIDRHFKNISNYKCIKTIRNMLKDHSIIPEHITNNITIDDGFPWEPLILHFKPFAILYHKIKYGLNPYSKYSNKTLFLKKLVLFIQENPYFGRKFIYSKECDIKPYFVFGNMDRSPYNTTVQTHFKDMNKEKLNAIKYNQIVRVGVARDRRIINNYNHDTDSSEESSEEEDGDLDSQIQEQNEEPVSQSEVTETPVN